MDFAKDILSVKRVYLIKHFRKIKSVSNNFTRLYSKNEKYSVYLQRPLLLYDETPKAIY